MSTGLNNAINLHMAGIRDGNAREAVTKYTGARYRQHSNGFSDGIEETGGAINGADCTID